MMLFILFLLPITVHTATDCPPGYYISKVYPAGTPMCSPCSPGTYTGLQNSLRKCLRCSTCSHNEEPKVACSTTSDVQCQCRQGYYYDPESEMCFPCSNCESSKVKVTTCNRTHDTVCKCKEGYYDKNGVCVKCGNCYLGEGVKSKCANNTDVTCELCKNGTFSDKVSSSNICYLYTMCTLGLTQLNFNVTWFDTICINCSMSTDLLDLETFFTINFVTQRRFPEDDLKNMFRLTYNKTRNDIDSANRDDVEGSFTYDPNLPYTMKQLDYLIASKFLMTAYKKISQICQL
ncbi:hypothetical protein LDVICp095 [lymphocystis disease virus-China]|uniref:Tumor necrosis factor receptor-like protein n=2 Tax=Lymphocystis disease virus 2 TaxID=159183 RepID=A0A6F8X2H6_9VIRU|nr:hypothetical protein LDVICp095 [lymphocystis disease virus-China]AAU10940.1 hypothetical protein [lymphocystis disease virus-China]BCB67466.1 tumor necrosis factor receptor-like protein [Lymphocystis disease virus 2]